MRSCWQIRQELAERSSNGQPVNGWLLSCAECAVRASQESCWEQCSGSPCCCAPLHITCDFCAIYIEHRREIALLAHKLGATQPTDLPCVPAELAAANRRSKGGHPVMEKVQFNVPDMWADHHVLKARAALSALNGVQDIVASSAFRMISLSYDPAVISPETIADALASAGYPVAPDGRGVVTQPVPVADGRKDPAWDRLRFRVARTDPRDVKK